MFTEEKTIPEGTQTQVPEDDEFLSGLFDDEDVLEEPDAAETETTGNGAAANTEAPENGAEDTPAAPEDTNPAAEEELIDLVYNGQTQSLPRSKIIELAQKGMNYDHIKGQLDGFKNSNTQKMLAKLASDAGISPDEYLGRVLGSIGDRQVQELADAEGISAELARRLLNAENKVKDYEASEQSRQSNAKFDNMLQNFAKNHPDVRAEDIPPEVWAKVQAGADLEGVYATHKNSQLQGEIDTLKATIEQLKQNKMNEQKAVGPVRGEQAGKDEDAFLQGLFGK
jgi:hypothetical protein